jgi:hypothetical protein
MTYLERRLGLTLVEAVSTHPAFFMPRGLKAPAFARSVVDMTWLRRRRRLLTLLCLALMLLAVVAPLAPLAPAVLPPSGPLVVVVTSTPLPSLHRERPDGLPHARLLPPRAPPLA